MFEQATLSYGPSTKRVWTTCLGITGQALIVLGMILTPMIWPEVLPKAQTFLVGPLVVPPRPPLPPQGPVVRPHGQQTPVRSNRFTMPPVWAPAAVPTRVAILDDPPDGSPIASGGSPHGIPGGIAEGLEGGVLTTDSVRVPPPRIVEPVAEPPKPKEPAVIRMKVSHLDPASLRHRVDPIYPPMAIQTRVSGTVELRGVIGVDGRIRELKVLRGHPFLVKAALDAVSQWIYEPTRLNGQTVEVDAPILVTFHLH